MNRWAACRETLIGHLEVHGVSPYSADDGITFVLSFGPPTPGRAVLRSSMFDNGPWCLTGRWQKTALPPYRAVLWDSISDDMLGSLEIHLVEQFLSTR